MWTSATFLMIAIKFTAVSFDNSVDVEFTKVLNSSSFALLMCSFVSKRSPRPTLLPLGNGLPKLHMIMVPFLVEHFVLLCNDTFSVFSTNSNVNTLPVYLERCSSATPGALCTVRFRTPIRPCWWRSPAAGSHRPGPNLDDTRSCRLLKQNKVRNRQLMAVKKRLCAITYIPAAEGSPKVSSCSGKYHPHHNPFEMLPRISSPMFRSVSASLPRCWLGCNSL